MNPVHFDFTLIAQVITLLVLGLIIFFFVYILVFVANKRKSAQEMLKKLDRIIELLESNKKE